MRHCQPAGLTLIETILCIGLFAMLLSSIAGCFFAFTDTINRAEARNDLENAGMSFMDGFLYSGDAASSTYFGIAAIAASTTPLYLDNILAGTYASATFSSLPIPGGYLRETFARTFFTP